MIKKIKIAALIVVYNEEMLLPYFLRHYEYLDEIHVLYETDSTDNTLKILERAPNVIIKKCHIEGGFDDINKVNLINNTLPTIKADWVYAVDCDEFIFPPQESPNDFLSRQARNKYNVVRAAMFQVYRHRTDKNLDPSLSPIPQRVHGDSDLFSTDEGVNKDYNAHYIKPIVVRPSNKIFFQPGNHDVDGNVKISTDIFVGAHWKMPDPEIALNRRIRNKIRTSKRNKQLGCGWQDHSVTKKEIKAECERHLNDPIIEELYLFDKKNFNNLVDKIRPRELLKLFKLPKEEKNKIRNFFSRLTHQLDTKVKNKAVDFFNLEGQKKQLQELSATLKLKDTQIQEKDSQIQEKDSQIAEKDTQIHNLEFQIQQIQQSILMQLASRYHIIMEKLLPLSTRRRHYYELCLSGIRIILSEGWRSFWYKLRLWFQEKKTIPGAQPLPLSKLNSTATENLNLLNNEVGQRPFGVNIGGYIASERGLGEAVRANIRSLSTTNIPYVLNYFIDIHAKNIDRTYTQFTEENPYNINLVHVNTFLDHNFMDRMRETYLRNHYNIGFWAWELSNFPLEWLSSFRYFNEIWVPSSFNQEAISLVAPIPVIKIPHSLPEILQLSDLTRPYFGLPEDSFIFLFVFSFRSHFNRKNPLGLIHAFQKAFSKKDRVCLVIQCAHSEFFPAEFLKMKKAAQYDKIIIIDKILSRNEINTLMYLCDCYVSLHRSEGFGLTMAEAMHLKKPVIATGHSGNMDFMNTSNSFLVKYELVGVKEKRGCPPLPSRKGYVWAEPDINHAAELMQYVYKNKQHASKIGKRASEDIKRNLNPKIVGSMVAKRLRIIKENS